MVSPSSRRDFLQRSFAAGSAIALAPIASCTTAHSTHLDLVLRGGTVVVWKAVDQAYGKPTEHVEMRAGPIDPVELETWSDQKIAARLAELEATSRQEEDG